MKLFRLLKILFVFLRFGIDDIVLVAPLFGPIRFVRYLNPRNWFPHNKNSRGVRIRRALVALGPIFVKFGQILSTRRDLLPDDIALELAKLQDQVPAFPGKQAKRIVEKAYGKPALEVFREFDEVPLASASVAQVHKATLNDGKEVIVKILRPKIGKVIKRDVGLMYLLAWLTEKCFADGPRLRPREIVAEFERHLGDELDLQREASNASQLRRNFENSHLIHVPEVYWPYMRRNVMVQERIHGIPVSDIDTLKAHNVNLKKLAERGVEIFFTQVFRDCFFHADMHPGNIFVSVENPEDPTYIAVDFGIMGSLSTSDQRYLAENLLAFFLRDYRRVAELHVASGWVPAGTRVDHFEATIRGVCEPIFEQPLKDISCGQTLLRLFQTASQFNMEIQPQLMLLQKTLLNIEGLGRELYPELDLWSTAKPFLEKWLKDQMGAKAFVRRVREQLPYWSENLPELPQLLHSVLSQRVEQLIPAAVQAITPKPEKPVKTASRLKDLSLGAGLVLLGMGLFAWYQAVIAQI